jgi:hypothetical protein
MTSECKDGSIPMRMRTAFMLGTISGAVFVGLWRRELRAYAAESSRRLRAKAANGVAALPRAEELLQDTRERIGTA